MRGNLIGRYLSAMALLAAHPGVQKLMLNLPGQIDRCGVAAVGALRFATRTWKVGKFS